ncbi:ABC transporter ATP-binding protein [Methylobacterium oxalidis]|uniref:ABC transporter ATP-binding protein n=1 Tax=Methylobacterium oxalidis TaxID=944322 RepID=A0A512J174_9HYPH|nr:ABC transporter ATP-binding protein [Methylobacterium oxalidis]GEP03599.1 ABC transporter ATP-binding protein [Methylobacterium oxalidis]GJE34304.1 Bicarbonate transport ATP-binding protein CmpD [Methylobacterium oxalidis]GLS64926.1 ABC transporter ATP-binding protein [Methylobacterium oxalidis]
MTARATQAGRAGRIELADVAIRLGQGEAAFDVVENVRLTIPAGQFVCLLGPSGCGKSTLLGALAGHLAPSRGRVSLDGETVAGPHPERGIVFQQHTLLPWKRALDNVAFGPKMRGLARGERLAQARAFLALVGLADFAERYPAELSGGMQQRVEIARVLINAPRVLLMDEPFGALDAQTRLMMQELLLDIWTRLPTTVVFVTHDIDEALFLADRVLVMSARPGRILEDIPLDFARPRGRDLVTDPGFVDLKRRCLDLLRPRDGKPPLPRLTPLGLPGVEAA